MRNRAGHRSFASCRRPARVVQRVPSPPRTTGMPLEPTPLDPLEMTPVGSDPELEPAAAASNQEIDVWWGAYAGRSMSPMFALCTLVSVNISLVIGWAWDEERL